MIAISVRNCVRPSQNVRYVDTGHVELSVATRLIVFNRIDPRGVLGHHLNEANSSNCKQGVKRIKTIRKVMVTEE
jgi:hypothetical protein